MCLQFNWLERLLGNNVGVVGGLDTSAECELELHILFLTVVHDADLVVAVVEACEVESKLEFIFLMHAN